MLDKLIDCFFGEEQDPRLKDDVIPQSGNDINKERRTIAEMKAECFSKEHRAMLESDFNVYPILLRYEAEYKARSKCFFDGETTLYEARFGEVIPLPKADEFRLLVSQWSQTDKAWQSICERIQARTLTSRDIRDVNYELYRKALAQAIGSTVKQAAHLIGRLDMAIHEGKEGKIYLVPNNLHRYIPHTGGASMLRDELNHS